MSTKTDRDLLAFAFHVNARAYLVGQLLWNVTTNQNGETVQTFLASVLVRRRPAE